MAETVNGRLYLAGSNNVGLVVFTALMAMAMVLENTTWPEASDQLVQTALRWSDIWFEADGLVKAAWANEYEKLMKISEEMADQAGAGEAF